MWYAVSIISVIIVGLLAFFMGRKMSGVPKAESKTTTFLIKSIQAIAELAVLEYITEGVTEIKEKKTSLITVRWKRGLLRYTAKLKVGFELDQMDYNINDSQKSIQIMLPNPRILSCEIYNRKFYKLPLEKAENIPWKYDIVEDFSSDEVLALDNEARNNALKNVNEFYVLDLLRDKTKLTFKKMFSLSYPEYTTDISIMEEPDSQTAGELTGDTASNDRASGSGK